jgi:hypothetical protein
MDPLFTDNLRQAIEAAGGSPIYITDPATNTSYVLLRADDYEKLGLGPVPDDVESMYPLLADLAPEDWEDLSHYEKQP